MKRRCTYLGLTLLLGGSIALADQPVSNVPVRIGQKRALLVPVKVGEATSANFLLDTGRGFNLITPDLAKKIGLEPNSKTKVKPLTGGEFELPSVKLPPLAVGDRSDNEQKAVVAEPGIFLGEESEKVDGILSLSFFKNHPFTIDYANQTLIFENSESLSKRRKAGTKVECRVSDENLVASVPLALTEPPPERPKPGGLAGLLPSFSGPPEAPKAWVQVDTGCDSLMLDSKLMFSLHIDATGGNITEKETTDQNGQKFRSFSSKMGKVELGENPPVSREKLPVVFRRLQAEGALGQNFLQRFQVTFDLPNNELIFSKAP